MLFVGPRIPILAGIDEHIELDALARQGIPVVAIGEGPDFAEGDTELMDAHARPRAAQIGLADGRAAAAQVQALLS
ncbi:hypothetical protein ABZ922_41615 [Streptomyces shenzhenensis]|uniref:hypothetical protein n=1 Tax=Streptomyces shenzhenensis TaxID=943815 RepID=UPI0033DD8E8C